MTVIAIDFETYSAASLPKVGLMNYVSDPHFTVLMAAVAEDNHTAIFDFATANDDDRASLVDQFKLRVLTAETVVAHNAVFERAVLKYAFGIDRPIVDSAVVASVMGANRHLAGAARQLLNMDKLDEDGRLVRMFCMPNEDSSSEEFSPWIAKVHAQEWLDFTTYCMRDAELSLKLYTHYVTDSTSWRRELRYADLTLKMNETGWPVDLPTVERMKSRYDDNCANLLQFFHDAVDPDLNLNSPVQVKEWAAKRGLKSKSFDRDHVEKMLKRIRKQPRNSVTKQLPTKDEQELEAMLSVKQQLGGSSLRKLQTIIDTTHEGRLYDQYAHAGAAQTLRTSARGVQMQNLKRLSHMRDMVDLADDTSAWSNEELAENLRQVFAAPGGGKLFVADFASIESRALAYLADEKWKLDAYLRGEDVYKRQAMQIYNLNLITQVTAEQRQTGKVGELSCGYGAGPDAVRDFAAKMHVDMTQDEAKRLVIDWRKANPMIEDLWTQLDSMLRAVVRRNTTESIPLPDGMHLTLRQDFTPASLIEQDPTAVSVYMDVWRGSLLLMSRVFHGCHLHGADIGYYKPSANKTGKPWVRSFTHPTTNQRVRYKLWGGKITGVLVQSFCRELFFEALKNFTWLSRNADNVQVVGQFHDEIVVEWQPGDTAPADVESWLEIAMSGSKLAPSLPMAVEVKSAKRYIK